MSLSIQASIVEGSGELPDQVGRNAIVSLQATGVQANTYTWFLLSKPQNSGAYITDPNSSRTKITNLDTFGNYHVQVWSDKDTFEQKTRTFSILVPNPSNVNVLPPEPLYDSGGRVLNFSFEVEGLLPGEASNWLTNDEANILDSGGGTTRGRIAPTNFNVNSGRFVMCLGDDIGVSGSFEVGQVFEVSQQVDLRGINTLQFQTRFIKRT
jgi:hypothetical protein